MFTLNGKYADAIVYTDNCEPEAISQIMNVLDQRSSVGQRIRIMPDVHAGVGCTIGTTMTITDKIIPNLVGEDIGCGMLALKLEKKQIDFSLMDLTVQFYVPNGSDIHDSAIASSCVEDILAPVDKEKALRSLGSLGGGGHFIEVDKDNEGFLWLVIHTGSGHLGTDVCSYYQNAAYDQIKESQNRYYESHSKEMTDSIDESESLGDFLHNSRKLREKLENKNASVPKELAYVSGQLFDDYMHDMLLVQEYAKMNREAIAKIILDRMELHSEFRFDTIHNYIEKRENELILRKGAVSAREGERVIIPMNMRDGSLICVGKGNPEWNYSAPYGAGRLLSRSKAKETISLSDFENSMQGIYTTSVEKGTLDESPMAYKPMQEIIDNIGDTVDIETTIKPVYNFKASEGRKILRT